VGEIKGVIGVGVGGVVKKGGGGGGGGGAPAVVKRTNRGKGRREGGERRD